MSSEEIKTEKKTSPARRTFTIIFWISAAVIWLLLAVVYQLGMEEVKRQEAEEAVAEEETEEFFAGGSIVFEPETYTGDNDYHGSSDVADNDMTDMGTEEIQELMQRILQSGSADMLESFEKSFGNIISTNPASIHIAASYGNTEIISCLLDKGIDPAAADGRGLTPADNAALADNFECVKYLLEKGSYLSFYDISAVQLAFAADNAGSVEKLLNAGISPDSVLPSGSSILYYAVCRDKREFAAALIAHGAKYSGLLAFSPSAEMSELLLEAGADPNELDPGHRTPFFAAAATGNISQMELLKAYGAVTDGRDRDGKTPFMFAVTSGNIAAVEYLAGQGSDVNAVSNSGQSPLHFAAALGLEEIMLRLIEAGADIEQRTTRYQSPLVVAAENGKWDCVEILIKNGAKPEDKEILFNAVACGTFKDVELLVEAGADIGVVASDRGNIIHHAVSGISADKSEMIKLFANAGINVNAGNISGLTPLHYAVKAEDQDAVKTLLEIGADINCRDVNNNTPLHFAVFNREIMERLLNAGADANAANDFRETALHLAVKAGLTEQVRMLLENGADKTLRDQWHKIPADYAVSMEIRQILQ